MQNKTLAAGTKVVVKGDDFEGTKEATVLEALNMGGIQMGYKAQIGRKVVRINSDIHGNFWVMSPVYRGS